ncbi:hypothetical protein CKO51_32500 [Rhodopirellula sp. SM50]|nr:hypothetical protein CKO51_32500 [Rhodopirellula sp. SM50]
MRHCCILTLIVVAPPAFSIATTSAPSACDDASCWSQWKFIDDLVRFSRPYPQRDPFEERIETERHDVTHSTKTVGHGVTQIDYYISDDFVFDLRASNGLSNDSADFLTGIGGGYRY